MRKPKPGEPTNKVVSLQDIFLSEEVDSRIESMRISDPATDRFDEFKKAWRAMEDEVLQAQHKVYPQGGLEIPEYMASFDIGEGMDGTVIHNNQMGKITIFKSGDKTIGELDMREAYMKGIKAKENEYKQLILDIYDIVLKLIIQTKRY